MDEIQSFAGGYLLTNTYLVPTPGGGHLMIDAPIDADSWIDSLKIKPLALLLTHQHFDHVMTAAAIAAKGIPIYAWEPFSRSLTLEHVFRQWGMPFDVPEYAVNHTLSQLTELEIDGLHLDIANVPGHSPDSITFYSGKHAALFAGDTLFNGSTGRGDLPGGNLDLLCRSITEKIYTLPPATRVLPGHGPETTVAQESSSNPIVRA